MASAVQPTAALPEDVPYKIEKVEVPQPDDNLVIREIKVDDVPEEDAHESLSDTIQQVQVDEIIQRSAARQQPGLVERPELPEDYVRNYLLRKGMTKTLHSFQTEWYEMEFKDLHTDPAPEAVPDCYLEVARLEGEIQKLTNDLGATQSKGFNTTAASAKLKKERDYHRLAHRQIKQEKRQLQNEISQLHAHYEGLEATVARLTKKYATVSVAKTNAVMDLEKSMKDVNDMMALSQKVLHLSQEASVASTPMAQDTGAMLPPPTAPNDDRPLASDSDMPSSPAFVEEDADDAPPLDSSHLQLASTFRAHESGVSSLATNRAGTMLGTTADDGSFKTWDIATGDLLLDGAGHEAWVAACKFHPTANVAATASGDTTVRVWNLDEAECTATFSDHAYAVWDVDFHCSGSFLASCSMDSTIKLWDLNSQRCRKTLRGHTDSVNSVQFQSNSNLCVSASVDRSCIVWDILSGLTVLTLNGHNNSCNQATFSPNNERIASVDADGAVKVWETRTATCLATAPGTKSANRVAYDSTGEFISVASDDCSVKVYNSSTLELVSELKAHSDAVQGVAYAGRAGPLISGGADGTVRLWK